MTNPKLNDLSRAEYDSLLFAAVTMTGPLVENDNRFTGTVDITPPAGRADEVANPEDRLYLGEFKLDHAQSYPAWQAELVQNFLRLRLLMEEDSEVGVALESIDKCKVFDGVVESVEVEEKSTRALITLVTGVSKWSPDGREQVRTDRTDKAAGKLMARQLHDLIGHRVRLWVEVVTTTKGSARIVRHAKDLGAHAGEK